VEPQRIVAAEEAGVPWSTSVLALHCLLASCSKGIAVSLGDFRWTKQSVPAAAFRSTCRSPGAANCAAAAVAPAKLASGFEDQQSRSWKPPEVDFVVAVAAAASAVDAADSLGAMLAMLPGLRLVGAEEVVELAAVDFEAVPSAVLARTAVAFG